MYPLPRIATLLLLASHLEYSSGQETLRPGDVLRGQYRCGQGNTAATLRVQSVNNLAANASGNRQEILGIFEFGSQFTPRGSYHVVGYFDANQSLTKFEPSGWIQRPERYEAVGFTLTTSAEINTFSGQVAFRNCGSISLQREDPPKSSVSALSPTTRNLAPEHVLELTTLTHATTLDEFNSLKLPGSCRWGKPDVHFYCTKDVAYAGQIPKDGAAVYFANGKISRIDISAGPVVASKIRAELDRRYGAHEVEITTHEGSPATTNSYQSGGTVLVPGQNGGFSEALAPAIATQGNSIPTTYNKATYRWKAPCIRATSSYGFATIGFVQC